MMTFEDPSRPLVRVHSLEGFAAGPLNAAYRLAVAALLPRLILVGLGAVELLPVPRASAESVKEVEPTHIEGEIHLPQVLFITSRESVRPLEFLDSYAELAMQALVDGFRTPGEIHVIPSNYEIFSLTDTMDHLDSHTLPIPTPTTIDSTAAPEHTTHPSASPVPAEPKAHISQREETQ